VSALFILGSQSVCQPRYDVSLGKELAAAVSGKDVDKTKSLLARHANPNTVDAQGTPLLIGVLISMEFSLNEAVSGQVSGDRHQAETAGIVKLLLEAGANPNAKDKQGNPVLMAAFVRSDPEIVANLIHAGASAKATDASGSPMIVEAAYTGNLKIVKLLVDAGAGVNQSRKDGTSALLVAANKQKWELCRYLVEKGADVNARLSVGSSLLFAAAGGDLDTVKLLVQKGADVNAKDDNNISPLMIAQKRNHKPIADFLVSAGARP
jgi:ankyrin repeat protein